jgi:outer membrane cobalamin receptor
MFGLEIQITMSPVRNVTLQTSLSLMDGKIKYQADEILTGRFSPYHVQLYNNGGFLTTTPMDQESIIRRPSMARMQLTYTGFKRWTPEVSLNYVDDREDVFYDTQIMPQGALNTIRVEKYALINISLSYKAGKNILMSACSNNTLDAKYSEVRGFTTRGRSILFRILWNH